MSLVSYEARVARRPRTRPAAAPSAHRSIRFAHLLFGPNPEQGLSRGLDLFCESAGIDRERARRWAQVRAIKAARWGRQHHDPDWAIQATDQLVGILT
ncbi:hypothetical protein [Nocardia abscessus]|uniref:hypothetical protein n=1 Tax=Nocardia abscessus TaxID=120957 RepID=UPI0002D53290|nr:hypothetical protein [Nocardia abscessus]MCC3332297.1 hypothetical protein [Nocardia abscessus]